MEEYDLKRALDDLHKELKLSLGLRNVVTVDFDRKVPSMVEGNASLLVKIIRGLTEIIAIHLVNGVIQIELCSEKAAEKGIPFSVSITGVGLQEAGDNKVKAEIKTLFPDLDVEITAYDRKISVVFICQVELFPGTEDDPFVFRDKRILLAEDNEVNVIVFSSFLEDWGTIPDVAGNGNEAVGLARSNTYDAILMDLHMPVMNGIEAIHEIRKYNTYTPIIVLSGITFQNDIDRALEFGANEFLRKPVSSWELFFALSKFLK